MHVEYWARKRKWTWTWCIWIGNKCRVFHSRVFACKMLIRMFECFKHVSSFVRSFVVLFYYRFFYLCQMHWSFATASLWARFYWFTSVASPKAISESGSNVRSSKITKITIENFHSNQLPHRLAIYFRSVGIIADGEG